MEYETNTGNRVFRNEKVCTSIMPYPRARPLRNLERKIRALMDARKVSAVQKKIPPGVFPDGSHLELPVFDGALRI
jgi:hypothetical protein